MVGWENLAAVFILRWYRGEDEGHDADVHSYVERGLRKATK